MNIIANAKCPMPECAGNLYLDEDVIKCTLCHYHYEKIPEFIQREIEKKCGNPRKPVRY